MNSTITLNQNEWLAVLELRQNRDEATDEALRERCRSKALEIDLAEAQVEIERLKLTNAELSKKLFSLKQNWNDLNNQYRVAESTAQDLSEHCDELSKQLDSRKRELSDSQQQLKQLDSTLQLLQVGAHQYSSRRSIQSDQTIKLQKLEQLVKSQASQIISLRTLAQCLHQQHSEESEQYVAQLATNHADHSVCVFVREKGVIDRWMQALTCFVLCVTALLGWIESETADFS